MWLNTDTREQFIVVRYTEDEVAALVFNCGDYHVDPWPEVVIPASCGAPIKVGDKMVDLLSPTGTSFVVHDGKKVYAGPCEPNSVKVLHWAKPKPKPKVPAAQVGAAATTAGTAAHTLAPPRGGGGGRLRARDDRPGHGRPRRSHGAHHRSARHRRVRSQRVRRV